MYKRPSYDIKTTGIFTFKTKDKEYLLKSYSFERENDTEDSLEIQDELRGEIGSIRIKNSAWNKLAKGQTILAKTSKSKGDIVGKLTRIDDINNSEKYAKGGISGDIFSVKDPKLFKQILSIYNEFSEKFGVDNYFLDHNNNSVIFLRKKPFTPTEIDNMSKRIFSLKEKQDFDVLNKYKNTESSGGTFKFFLKNSIKYADGGMSIADANPYIAGAKAVQGIAPESVSALDKRISSRINPDPNRPVFFNLGGRLDLFEDYENIPAKVQAVLDKYADKFGDDFSEMSYSDTAKMQKDIEKLGYTFDSGLDNMPYGLRPIGVKLSELQGFEDDSEYKTGGSVKVNSGDGDDEILFRDFTKGDLKFVNYQEKTLSNNKVTYLYLHTYNSMKDAKADGGKDYVYLERNGKIFSFFPSIETYEQDLSSKYAKGGWILYDADTDSKIREFETETKARKMMYEYEGNSNIVAKSVWDKSSEKDKSYKNNTMEKKTSRFAKGGGVKGKLLELYEFYDEKTNKTLLVDAYSEKEAEDKISKIDFNDFQDYDNISFKKVKNIKDVDTKNFKIEDYKKGKSIIKIFYDKDGSIAYIFTAKGSLLKEFSFDRNSKYIFNEEENYGYYTDKDSFSKGGATYIPNADIESIKLRYGKTIKGSKLLDGAYAKGNLKTPTMSRTQFEEETFEYAKGGGVSYHNGREYATGRNWTNDHKHENRSEDWEVAQADRKRFVRGGGVDGDDRMYNFLKEDLDKLQNAIKDGDNEEVDRFFNYWSYHLKSLKTKNNDTMYNFLKDDLKELENGIIDGDNQKVDRFFSYWNYHIKSLKMAKGGGVGNFKVVTFTGDYGGEDNNYYVVDETENDYLTVQEDMFNKWKNADKFDRAKYYSEWIPKSEMVEINKMAKGGGVNSKRHTPRIYVADLEAYNNGRLKGEWIDLSDFDSGAEVLEEISKMLKKTGGEEYAIHDYEYFPSIMYSEYMGEKQFDNVIEAYKIAEDKDLDIDVVGEIIEQYSPDNVEEFIDDNYQGQFDNDTDFAYQYVENLGGFENINESEKEMYFDYEAFGRDLVINDFFTINDHYFVNPRYARGGTTYIPNRDIESIKLRYGKTIKGSRLLDGAYAKGNLKTPTMSRTQFEDESFEYAKGGGIKSEYHIFEGMNSRNGNPIYRVESNFDSENEYVGEWHTSKSEAEEELADCSSKYAKGGGVSYHNGREYATGRNWTNDHKHENRSEDWEVAQADRKRFAKGGGVGKNIYNVAFSTKNGSSYVANNIEASSEAEAISKLEKQMRASKTYDKVISVSKKYSLGGEIETKIAKLQVVIDSKLLPDSVKVSAKTKQDALRKELHESKETKAEEKAEHKVGGEEARKTVPTQKAKPTAKPKAVVEPKIQIKAIKLQPKATAQEKPKVVVTEKPKATVITKTTAKTTSTKKYDNRGSKKPDSEGRFKRSITSDKKRTALPLGKRMSADGNVYYENRLNRADRNPSKKYETGGGVSRERFNLSFNYNPSNLSNEDAEKIVEQYTNDWKHNNDFDNVSFYVFNLTKDKADELKALLKMEDVYNIEMLFKNGGSLPKGRFTKK